MMDDDWKNDHRIAGEKPWLVSEDEMLAQMQEKPDGWFLFGEFDSIRALLDLLNAGKVELHPTWNNRYSGLVTSIRARAIPPAAD